MTRSKQKPARAVDAVQGALDLEGKRRNGSMQPIEIVKCALSAYQSFYSLGKAGRPFVESVESNDRAGLRRGTQASLDRLLFNVNYWLSAYEDMIAATALDEDETRTLLHSIAAWNSHTMRLNTLSASETVAVFERFCPPFSTNNRRGKEKRSGFGKGPVPDFKRQVGLISASKPPNVQERLRLIVDEIEAEARLYDQYRSSSSLDALYELLPAWCLQERIDLVRAAWWSDPDVMALIASRISSRFAELGYAQPLCSYYLDAMMESIDNYTRTVSTDASPYADTPVPELVELVKRARAKHSDFETEGYGTDLPHWLCSLEQLIWNTVVCAIYGPMHARPLLADSLAALPLEGQPANSDVITELAWKAYQGYLDARSRSGVTPEFPTYAEQPIDLRNSGLERIESIPRMLDVLGYRIVPLASCYPEQRIHALKPSEVELLAILEHRRWLAERREAGWTFAKQKDIAARQSPYLVDWEELPERAREWNRASARDIPAVLASAGLAISQ